MSGSSFFDNFKKIFRLFLLLTISTLGGKITDIGKRSLPLKEKKPS